MDYTNKKITLEDGTTYIVIDQLEVSNKVYLYLVNSLDEDETRFVEIRDGNILEIDPELFSKEILPLFLEKINE